MPGHGSRSLRSIGISLSTICALLGASAAFASEDPEALSEWSVRAQPDGTLTSSVAGVFHRVSNRSDLGCEVFLSWNDRDDDGVSQSFDDGRETVSDGFDRSHTVTVYPEWRHWSDIWGENRGLAIRSYWGIRMIAGVGQSTSENSYRETRPGRVDGSTSEEESDEWDLGAGLSIGMSARIWGPISFSAALTPVTVTRSHYRRLRTEISKSTSEPDEFNKRITEDTNDRTTVSFILDPRLYVVLSW